MKLGELAINIILGIGILLIGLIANIVILVFLANWGGIPGAFIFFVFSSVGLITCLIISIFRPRLWMVWPILFSLMNVVILIEKASGAAIPIRAVKGIVAAAIFSFVGALIGKRISK